MGNIIQVTTVTNGLDLHEKTLNVVFGIPNNNDGKHGAAVIQSPAIESLKLLFKGKRIAAQSDNFPFEGMSTAKTKKPLKILVMATSISAIQDLSKKRSDPTIRGFDEEKNVIEKRKMSASQKYWADVVMQHRDYKFCRLKACTD